MHCSVDKYIAVFVNMLMYMQMHLTKYFAVFYKCVAVFTNTAMYTFITHALQC